jgi:signal transduction histidine kinase
LSAAWLATARSERETVEQLRRLANTLNGAQFPVSKVLDPMKGLSGAEFVAIDDKGQIIASTVPRASPREIAQIVSSAPGMDALIDRPSAQLMNVRYFPALLPASRPSDYAALLVLYPEQRWRAARRDAAWPPLAIGAVTLLLMVAMSAWLSRRLGTRIRNVQELFAQIADGEFGHAMASWPRDELHELILSANRLSDQLQQMQHTIRHTERMRLLAQLAGGLAHQLRNAVTGARMAVQLHQKRCGNAASDDSLQVALRQLTLTEEQVKGLLAMGRQQPQTTNQGNLLDLLREVEQLLSPACSHAHVMWKCILPENANQVRIDDFENVRSALLNLALNAIEAARASGTVEIRTSVHQQTIQLDVCDSGPGPAADLKDTLFEPFVSSKPEGVGLGLAIARQVAEMQGGTLEWRRSEGQTIFRLSLPISDSSALYSPLSADTSRDPRPAQSH